MAPGNPFPQSGPVGYVRVDTAALRAREEREAALLPAPEPPAPTPPLKHTKPPSPPPNRPVAGTAAKSRPKPTTATKAPAPEKSTPAAGGGKKPGDKVLVKVTAEEVKLARAQLKRLDELAKSLETW